jgi:hypothetical protein
MLLPDPSDVSHPTAGPRGSDNVSRETQLDPDIYLIFLDLTVK